MAAFFTQAAANKRLATTSSSATSTTSKPATPSIFRRTFDYLKSDAAEPYVGAVKKFTYFVIACYLVKNYGSQLAPEVAPPTTTDSSAASSGAPVAGGLPATL